LGAHVVGFTGIDGIGLSGVELALNDELLHDKPIASVIKDGKGNPSYVDKGYLKGQDVKPGTYLTLDRRVQNIIEEEIEKTRSDFKAKSAMAIVMDPNSGEVFALAQSPAFDPNMPNQSPSENQRNSVISGLFEPGSTMKVLLASELLEQKLADPKTNFDCGNGELVIYDKTIREAEAIHRFKQLSLEKIIRYSSNVGAVRFGQLLGKERFKEMFARFGLNRKTGIDLPGENSSPIKNNYLDIPLHLATASFGQGIAVTPLQMVTAFAPIANGGFYVTPKLLVKDVNPFEPKKRILSDFTAKRMREILTSVVESGTGANAKLTGIQVAGKTGTAQKFEGAKGYSGGKYFSSFIGFLPADKPKLLIGVMVDEPTEKYFAADVAVPLFKRIGERVIYTMDLMPKPQFTKSNSKELPSYRVSKADLVATENGQWVMPDLQGRSLRDLMKSVGGVFDSLIIEGSGYVNKQDPAPGVPVSSQTPIKLTLNP
jgi:cell division protein FtsI (penicillin-binding protein 3)